MKKGIIMEMDDTFLTLLTPEGEFLRARKSQHSNVIGEEIQFNPVMQKSFLFNLPKIERVKHRHVWAASAAAALLIFLGSLLPMYQDNKAYAYMSIDGSSSIEMGINKQIEVVKLTGFNNEGKTVITHISNWKKKDAAVIAEAILVEMQKEGLLGNNNQVIVSTVPTGQEQAITEKKLTECLAEIKRAAQKDRLQLSLVKGTQKDREKAREKGLTIGKYEEIQKNSSVVAPPVERPNKEQTTGNVLTPQNNSRQQTQIVSPKKPDVPPGKLKQQSETARHVPALPKSNGQIKAYTPSPGIRKAPPGLEKKKNEEQGKVNKGQLKKRTYFTQFEKPERALTKEKLPNKQENRSKAHKDH